MPSKHCKIIIALTLISFSTGHQVSSRISPSPRVSSLRDHIQNILQMSDGNLLSSMFTIKSPNPAYIFQLPTSNYHETKSLVLRRSDFGPAIYPNVTELREYRAKFGQFQSATPKWDADDRHGLSAQLVNFKSSNPNLEDTVVQKVVEDNVKSERDFADFVADLNRNQERFSAINPTASASRRNSWKSRIKKKQQKQRVDWDSLGLPGWAGGLTDVDYFGDDEAGELFKDTVLKSTTRGAGTFQSFGITTPFEGQKTSVYTKNTYGTTKATKEFWDIDTKIPEELMDLLRSEDLRLYNMTRVLKQQRLPHFPITTSRSKHRDDDVFIARANNPFGHSTKWEKR